MRCTQHIIDGYIGIIFIIILLLLEMATDQWFTDGINIRWTVLVFGAFTKGSLTKN